MKFVLSSFAGLLAVALAGTVLAGGALKSGPQLGQELPGAFHPLNVTGPWVGEKHCLYCEYGNDPVAMIFARNLTPDVAKLIKQIDAATAKNKKAEMHSFVVFLSADAELPKQLKDVAKKEEIQHTVLAIDQPVGPEEYKVAKEADVTVVLYVGCKVQSNVAFTKGQLNDKAITQIVADISKILPKQ